MIMRTASLNREYTRNILVVQHLIAFRQKLAGLAEIDWKIPAVRDPIAFRQKLAEIAEIDWKIRAVRQRLVELTEIDRL